MLVASRFGSLACARRRVPIALFHADWTRPRTFPTTASSWRTVSSTSSPSGGGSESGARHIVRKEDPGVLVTIPSANYAEKARWALQLTGVPFVEDKWAPLLAYCSTVPKGGKSVPLLALPSSPKLVLTDSADIMAFCAHKSPELYANEDAKRLEALYDSKLGPHTRRCFYFLLSEDPEMIKKVISGPIEGFVRYHVTRMLLPAIRPLLLRALNINAMSAERSWARVEQMLDEAELRLGDGPIGSRFLAGDAFSAADISFCAHVSLLLLPPEHGYLAPYLSVDRVENTVFRERFEKLQCSKIGRYVLWCYKHKRPPMDAKTRV